MDNQQKEGVHYQLSELNVPMMEATDVRLFMAIAAKHGFTVFKSDANQAFLNGDIRDEKIYISAPDWWPELQRVLEGHALLLMKSMYGTEPGTRQAT